MKIKLAIGQINTFLGDPETNMEVHLAYSHNAIKAGADLLVFPELSLTGYGLQDLATTVVHRASPSDPIFRPLLEASNDIDLNQLHRTRARLPLLRDERTGLFQREMDRVVKSVRGYHG